MDGVCHNVKAKEGKKKQVTVNFKVQIKTMSKLNHLQNDNCSDKKTLGQVNITLTDFLSHNTIIL